MKKLDDIFKDDELPNQHIYEMAQTVIRDYMDRIGKSIGYVAEELGTTEGYLYATLQPKKTEKPLSIDRAIAITKLTGDYRILEAMAKDFGLIVTNPKPISTSGETLVFALVDKGFGLEESQGALAKDIRASIKDGVIDEGEKKKLREDAFALMKKATEMLESLK